MVTAADICRIDRRPKESLDLWAGARQHDRLDIRSLIYLYDTAPC
jgi:hypothetical protein